jgi:hypothetical protein
MSERIMSSYGVIAIGILQFAFLGRYLFFDSWQEFKMAFHFVLRPQDLPLRSGYLLRVRFATMKLALLVSLTSLLSGIIGLTMAQ